jgi:hypothetical protein
MGTSKFNVTATLSGLLLPIICHFGCVVQCPLQFVCVFSLTWLHWGHVGPQRGRDMWMCYSSHRVDVPNPVAVEAEGLTVLTPILS